MQGGASPKEISPVRKRKIMRALCHSPEFKKRPKQAVDAAAFTCNRLRQSQVTIRCNGQPAGRWEKRRVEDAYYTVLGRAPDTAGGEYYTCSLMDENEGRASRSPIGDTHQTATMVHALCTSSEFATSPVYHSAAKSVCKATSTSAAPPRQAAAPLHAPPRQAMKRRRTILGQTPKQRAAPVDKGRVPAAPTLGGFKPITWPAAAHPNPDLARRASADADAHSADGSADGGAGPFG